MAVSGDYMAGQVRELAGRSVGAYAKSLFEDLLPVFENPESKAERVTNDEYQRIGSQPAFNQPDVHMADIAEAAWRKGQSFYETMVPIRQTILNLVAAGLYHLVEQQLAETCRDGAFDVLPPTDTALGEVANWYLEHFDLSLGKLPSWKKIDELQLLANAVKHGEGRSAKKLRALCPRVFIHPYDAGLKDLGLPPASSVRLPLAGADLYVTEELLRGYCDAAEAFFEEIAKHFEDRADEYYPR